MSTGRGSSGESGGQRGAPRSHGLGAALRSAWVGYHRRLDEEMAAAGFSDRAFPDGRVLRLCRRDEGVTVAQIGREIGITRQGAGKVVARLQAQRFVTVTDSATSGREKTVRISALGRDYLAAHRSAAERIEQQLVDQVGVTAVDDLRRVLVALGGGPDQPRLRDYLRRVTDVEDGTV